MSATYIVGDVRDTLAAMPDGSVDLILTSPPFLALRSYLPADHPDKHREIGSEQGPAEFLDTLLALSAEWRRVLAPHGSMAVELGDTYAGSGGGDGARSGARQSPPLADLSSGTRFTVDGNGGDGWPEAKSLALIPELYRIGLAYGINPLTGGLSPAGRWKVRNVVRWCRPNPPVGALGDKFRPGTSDMVIACTSGKRWFDLDAVRAEVQHPNQKATRNGKSATDNPEVSGRGLKDYDASMSAGAPPLDWWQVSTEPYAGSHYATWPRKLLTRPILAMCPLKVCTVCGEPSRRIAETTNAVGRAVGRASWDDGTDGIGAGHSGAIQVHANDRTVPDFAERVTLGWTDCGHDSWRNGIVLDPFAGSGTTLAVATGHGRDAIGIDIDSRNVDLARDRVGPMFLQDTTLAQYEEIPA